MSEKLLPDANIDPERLYENEYVDTERRTYTHEDTDHCEADTEGLAIAGITDDDGRLLVLIDPAAGHAVLPNDTVGDGDDWAMVAREHVAAAAGIEITVDDVRLVRRVDHVVEGEGIRETTHHVLFAASRDGGQFEGLCETNDWEFQWCEEIPVDRSGDDDGALEDIERFLE